MNCRAPHIRHHSGTGLSWNRSPPQSRISDLKEEARWTTTSGSVKRSRSCMHAATGVPDEDCDECVDDSEEPNVCESEVPMFLSSAGCGGSAAPYFGAHDDGEDGLEIAAAAEKAIIRMKKTRQTSIMDFFAGNVSMLTKFVKT
ncbi:hypothetical protein HPB47_020392 [Ixodes persulcatus]|uniref:Uncharacterized protein n=1 Tax=Ixodes persulcatus TaxID=34615 RepID=A0AC60QFU0_IXOPE|nr:hypothetical protein HPB47_020392 [Ixodes persulcatus]